uniref:Uncharacterized protein n=1 Tax=Ditylenchus dipsaci TaxID=166011 RepID=A0A915CZ96_9BILA
MSATEISPIINEKQHTDLGLLLLDMESRIIEQFKGVISSFVEDLVDRLDSIYDDVGRMMQSMEKVVEKLISYQHKLRVQLQQQTPAENFKYRPLEQFRDPWTIRSAYRGREYRGGRQQDQIYHQGYLKPEPTFQRPQYDSSPRYRPDFEPNHSFRSDFDGNQRYKPDYDGNQRFKPDYNGSQHYRPDYGTNQQSRPEFEPNQRFQKNNTVQAILPKQILIARTLTAMASTLSKETLLL